MAGKLEPPYLHRKGINLDDLVDVCGSRVFPKKAKVAIFNEDDEVVDSHEGVFLFRELVDATGAAMGFERILDEKVKVRPDKKEGDKYLTTGSSTSGFTPIGFTPKEMPHLSGSVVVCCGLADGYRIHEATGLPVICGVGEPSLSKLAKMAYTVCNSFGQRADILVAADNDKAGITAAMRTGFPWTVPGEHKDWSDVYEAEGPAAVRENLVCIQEAVPADELEDRLAERGIAIGGNPSAKKVSSRNSWTGREPVEGNHLGAVTVTLGDPRAIEGIDQYLDLLTHLGVVASKSTRHIEADTLEAHGLLVSMLTDGLMASLEGADQDLAEVHADNVIRMASRGEMDNVEVVTRAPVLVTPGEASTGRAALRVRFSYDKTVQAACKSAGGSWEKAVGEWVVPADTERALDAALNHLLGAASGRVVANISHGDGTPGFITGSPARMASFKASLLPEIESTWAKQPAKAEKAPSYAISDKNGWPLVSIRLPHDAIEKRDVLKEMGAKFIGKEKCWTLPLRAEVLDQLEAWGARTEGPGLGQIRHALEICGFGYLEGIGDGMYAVAAPYHQPLTERIKDGLPRLARRYDADGKSWHIDASSAVVAQELRAIAEEFDLRLLDTEGQPLPPQVGWDEVLSPGSCRAQASESVSYQAGSARHQPRATAATGPGL